MQISFLLIKSNKQQKEENQSISQKKRDNYLVEKKEITWAYWKTEDLELVLHWKTWKELAFFRCMMHLKWLLLLLSKMLVLYWVNLQFARCGLGIVVSHTFGRERHNLRVKKLALECNTTLTTRPMHVNACYLISKTTKTTKTKRLNDQNEMIWTNWL